MEYISTSYFNEQEGKEPISEALYGHDRPANWYLVYAGDLESPHAGAPVEGPSHVHHGSCVDVSVHPHRHLPHRPTRPPPAEPAARRSPSPDRSPPPD